MQQSIDQFAHHLLERIFTTETLKRVSDTLEDLSQNRTFKIHANAIVTDPSLTAAQKKTQLLYIIKTVELPILYDFFSDEITARNFWLFDNEKIEYFDRFVQAFQKSTEEIGILYLTTAIELDSQDLKRITQDLSKSFSYKIIVNHNVNPAIMGGAQARLENLVFDMSLRSKFQQFQRHWLSSLDTTSKLTGRHETV